MLKNFEIETLKVLVTKTQQPKKNFFFKKGLILCFSSNIIQTLS